MCQKISINIVKYLKDATMGSCNVTCYKKICSIQNMQHLVVKLKGKKSLIPKLSKNIVSFLTAYTCDFTKISYFYLYLHIPPHHHNNIIN